MHIRSISLIVHGHSKFYAQNVSLIPVYNKIFVDSRAKLKPEGFDGDLCSWDPDLPIYRNNWIEHNAQALVNVLELDNFIAMNGGSINCNPNDWLKLDMFYRQALTLAFNNYAKEENKKQSQMKADLDQKLEASKDYKSPFSGVSKPTFID